MDSEQIVRFHPLTFIQEKDGISIGRFGTNQFAIFPKDGAELVKKLQSELTISEAAQWYETTYHETVDMEDFLDTLKDLGFLCEDDHAENSSVPVYLTRLGAVAFSPYAWFVYVLLFSVSVYFIYLLPSLRPSYQNIFFSPYFVLVELGLLVGQLPGVFFHEFFHMMAGWRKGIPCRLSIGRRIYFVVIETSMPGIWGLRRNERYLPYLSGLVGDLVWFSLLTISAGLLILSAGAVTLTAAFLVAMAFSTLLRLLWQFYFYLQTDIYYVITNVLGCINLQQVTREYLWNKWYRFIGKTHKLTDESAWPETDRKVARWYVWLYSGGWVMTWAVFLFVVFPAIEHIAHELWARLTSGTLEEHPHAFWDSIAFLLLAVLQLFLAAWLALKERKARNS